MATHPRPLPQPPSSARLQASRPTTSDTTKTNVPTSTTVSDTAKQNVPSTLTTTKTSTPTSNSISFYKTEARQTQLACDTRKDLVNSGLGRVIASPAVQRQLFADQTFSNKDGYKRAVVTVSNSSSTNTGSGAKSQCDKGTSDTNSILTGVAHSNKVSNSRPPTPKSSIPRPGTAKEYKQANTQDTDNEKVQKTAVAKPTKHITPFSKGSIKTGRSFTSSHLSIKPPAGPHKDSLLKVRNLNYTPNKPYSEVSEPGSPLGERAPCSNGNSSCNSPFPEQNSNLTTNGMYFQIFVVSFLPVSVVVYSMERCKLLVLLLFSTRLMCFNFCYFFLFDIIKFTI